MQFLAGGITKVIGAAANSRGSYSHLIPRGQGAGWDSKEREGARYSKGKVTEDGEGFWGSTAAAKCLTGCRVAKWAAAGRTGEEATMGWREKMGAGEWVATGKREWGVGAGEFFWRKERAERSSRIGILGGRAAGRDARRYGASALGSTRSTSEVRWGGPPGGSGTAVGCKRMRAQGSARRYGQAGGSTRFASGFRSRCRGCVRRRFGVLSTGWCGSRRRRSGCRGLRRSGNWCRRSC